MSLWRERGFCARSRVSHPVIRCSSQVGIGIAALFMLAAACRVHRRPTAIVTLDRASHR